MLIDYIIILPFIIILINMRVQAEVMNLVANTNVVEQHVVTDSTEEHYIKED